jgi:hypothetical protein
MTIATLAVAAALTGCAAQVRKGASDGQAVRVPAESAQRVVMQMTGAPDSMQAKDWEQFKGERRAALKTESDAAGISFSMHDAPVRPAPEAGTLLSVHVNDYRYLSPGARYGFGIMTGNAFIDATVGFSDLRTGQRFGEQRFNTSSSAWEGIFSAMTDKQVQAIAKDIIADVKPR